MNPRDDGRAWQQRGELLRVIAPKESHEMTATLFSERPDCRIGEGGPSCFGMCRGLTKLRSQVTIQQKHALSLPASNVAAEGDIRQIGA